MMYRKAIVNTLLLVTLATTAQALAGQIEVRIEDGLLINSNANYYLALPPEWAVKDASNWQHVIIVQQDSGATITLLYELARSDGNPLSLALASALGPESDFKPDKTGAARLGGQLAMELRGARTGKDGTRERLRCLVTEVDKHTLSLTSVVADAASQKVSGQIDQIIETLKFGKPRNSR
jgi:hypothetical protein